MRNRLLRHKGRNLNPRKPLLPTMLIIAAERVMARRQLIEVVVLLVTATNDRGLHMRVSSRGAGEVRAPRTGGPGCVAAAAIAVAAC